jgi:hypothetical protein
MITKIEAVRSLFGRDSYEMCRADGLVKWRDGHTTTAEETAQIDAEETRLLAEYDAQEYARNRKAEYDQLNQFEMIFDDDRDSTTTWVDKINEIIGRHPK